MKACNECHVNIETGGEFCPLCGAALQPATTNAITPPPNPYPDLGGRTAQYNVLLRVFIFLSLLAVGASVLVNLLVPVGFWWCLIVIAGVAWLWLAIPPMLRRGANYAKRAVFLAIFTSLLVVALDFIIGWQGWSVTYAVPGLFCGGTFAIGMMVIFNRTSWAQYVFYQVLMGVFGFVPLLLYFLGISQSLVMVLITAGLSLASLLVTVVFGDRSLKHDFKRRFHL